MLAAPSVSWLLTLILHARAFQTDTLPPHPYDEAVDNGTFGYYPTWSYATEPDIIAPKTNWLQWSPECNDGLFYFITPRGWGIERPGPMILDWKGDLVWSKHFANEWGGQAYDFMVQNYQGQEYLTFWTGDDRVRGHGSGSYMMLDSSYELIHSVDAGHNLTADLHEFLLTPDGTALITVYQKYQYDLSTWRTFNATADPNDADPNWIWDCVLQEVAVSTGDVLFEWRASEHIDINDTYHAFRQAGNHEDPFDWFHMNSIQKDELGNYLVSARYTHSITYIDGRSGKVIWTLGGKQNMFMDLSEGHAINFAWQHDAQFVSPDMLPVTYKPPREQSGYTTRLISLFDNAAEDQNYAYGMNMSRGLLLELTFPTPGLKATGKKGRPRDISHLRKLAAESNQHISKIASQTRPNLPYPNYGKDKPESTEDVEALKFNQINGSNPSYTVRLIQSYYNPAHVRSSSQGSMQLLPPTSNDTDAKVLLGYGLNAVFTEFDANGTALCDAHYGAVTSWERGDIQSYRAYKLPWVGRPKYAPRLVVGEEDEHTAHVSWNGATEVAAWILQTSDRNDTGWRELQSKPRLGFETSFDFSSNPLNTAPERFLRAKALDKQGKALEHGTSEPLDRVAVARQFAEAKEALAAEEAEQREKSDNSSSSSKNPPSRASVLTGAVLVLVAAFSLYEAYRRYLCWKVGRPAVGAVRWRKGGGGSAGYRLLGDL